MATHAVVTNSGEPETGATVEPDRSQWTFLQDLHYMLGMWDGVPGHPVVAKQMPEWQWVPNDRWKRGRGLLSDHPEHDTTEMKARARAEEEEHDARKFGRSRQ